MGSVYGVLCILTAVVNCFVWNPSIFWEMCKKLKLFGGPQECIP